MSAKTDIQALAHQLGDRMDRESLEALLDLLDEEFFYARGDSDDQRIAPFRRMVGLAGKTGGSQ
jgi:predicted phosphodiesterase